MSLVLLIASRRSRLYPVSSSFECIYISFVSVDVSDRRTAVEEEIMYVFSFDRFCRFAYGILEGINITDIFKKVWIMERMFDFNHICCVIIARHCLTWLILFIALPTISSRTAEYRYFLSWNYRQDYKLYTMEIKIFVLNVKIDRPYIFRPISLSYILVMVCSLNPIIKVVGGRLTPDLKPPWFFYILIIVGIMYARSKYVLILY